jgi:hypothetical protein
MARNRETVEEVPQPREAGDIEDQALPAPLHESGSSAISAPGGHLPQRRIRSQHGTIRYASFACTGEPSTLQDALGRCTLPAGHGKRDSCTSQE